MSQRQEFVLLAQKPGVNFKMLCRRFRISRKTGYKWKRRFAAGGEDALADGSRRPQRSPRTIAPAAAEAVLSVREAHPTWGGRKLRRRLQDLQHATVPAASTCTEILRRAHLLNPQAAVQPMQRFERGRPNELWQMDFKGHFATQSGERCHPLTVLDDHSRFNLVLDAHRNEQGAVVRGSLEGAFDRYGLPEEILCDNGTPWGQADGCPYTSLGVWLLQLGVRLTHGRPYHPQTQGKEERFNRTLSVELISRHNWQDVTHCAVHFPVYRQTYNCVRPHDALGGDTPISRYRPSPRPRPTVLPPIEYPASFTIRRVSQAGLFSFAGRTWQIGAAFARLPIGLRPSAQADGQSEVYFCHHRLGSVDLRVPPDPQRGYLSVFSSSNKNPA